MDSDFYLQINTNDPDDMYAEGTCDRRNEHGKIREEVLKRGYKAFDISMFYDTFQYVWRFTCDIKDL